MAVTYSFVDGATYGTEDINDIARSLIGAGVAPFVSKDSYNVSDLNSMTLALVGTGTSLDGCKCTIAGAGTTEMTVTVGQGIMFFESGVRMTVDQDGYILHITPNTEGYVYGHFSPTLQTAGIVFSAELPTDGEYVMLAHISAMGEVTDKRSFARSKVGTLGQNITQEAEIVRGVPEGITSALGANIYGYIENVDFSHFNYMLLDNLGSEGSNNGRAIFSIKQNSIWLRINNIIIGKPSSLKYGTTGNAFNSSCNVEVIGDKIVFSSEGTSFTYPRVTFI